MERHDMTGVILPLEIVGSWIFVLSIWTEWTNVSRRLMNQSMSDHFVLPLESFAAFATWTALDRAVVRPILGMDIGM